MAGLEYPTLLPCAQPGGFDLRERRAVSAIEGPLQLRARQRDRAGTQSRYVFTYTAEQMAQWRLWYAETLIYGRRWFAINLPGKSGMQPRIARYASVSESLLGRGIYRVTVSFEQRGASAVPTLEPADYWIEDFAGCSLAEYSAVSGNQGLFSIEGTDYGCSLSIAAQTSGTIAAMQRSIPSRTVRNLRIKFRLSSLNADDAGICTLLESGSSRISFNPRREASFDASRRARLVMGSEGLAVTAGSVSANTWYEMRLDINPGAGNTVCDIVRLSDNQLVSSTALAQDHSQPEVDQLRFSADQGLLTSPTLYDDIAVNSQL